MAVHRLQMLLLICTLVFEHLYCKTALLHDTLSLLAITLLP